MNLETIELKAFVPAKDFEVSKRFYETLGFEKKSDGHDVAYFACGETAFLLQDFYVKELAENFMMHLLVKDVDEWHQHVQALDLPRLFEGVTVSALKQQPWRMKEFFVTDPSGVVWSIAQNTD